MVKPVRGWGNYSLRLKFPVVDFCFSELSEMQYSGLRRNFSNFVAVDQDISSANDVQCRAFRLEHPPQLPLSEFVSFDNQYVPKKNHHPDFVELIGENFVARFKNSATHTETSLGVFKEQDFALYVVVENYLRHYIAHRVLDLGGVLLHSAGLVSEGYAYIFVGRSGAGKTTLTRKAYQDECVILSDDINLLLPNQSGFDAFAVPFAGEFGHTVAHEQGLNKAHSYPVRCAVLMQQGSDLQTSKVSDAAAFAKLLIGSPFVNADIDEAAKLLEVLASITRSVPVISLISRREDSFHAIMNSVNGQIGLDKMLNENG